MDCHFLIGFCLTSVCRLSHLTSLELGKFSLDQEFELRLDAGLRGKIAVALRLDRLKEQFGILYQRGRFSISSNEKAVFDNPGGEAFYKRQREAFVHYLSKLSKLSGKLGESPIALYAQVLSYVLILHSLNSSLLR